jgi:hypothetical protein
MRLTLLVIASLACGPALANPAPLPGCEAQLRRAWLLVEQVAARDRAGPIRDQARLCQTLRQNLAEMSEATGYMQRCLTGHARGENVGQMRASIDDVTAVLNRRCR